MIGIPAKYFEIGVVIDSTFIIMSLLLRKSKRQRENSFDLRKHGMLLGLYLIIASASALIVSHLALYTNYMNYLTGLSLNAFLFYLGLRCLHV